MKKIVFYIAVLLALLVVSCDMDLSDSGQYFEYDLRGTWRSTGTFLYHGELIINYSSIIVNGYNIQFDDNLFKNITPGVSLEGYSVKGESVNKTSRKGEIFIYDSGSLQDGIPYLYWEGAYDENYIRPKFLTFYFGDKKETLKYIFEDN